MDGREAATCYSSAPESYASRPTVRSPRALHFMGMTPDARSTHMARHAEAVLKKLGAGG